MIQTAIEHNRELKRIARNASATAAGIWALMGDDFDASWRIISPAIYDTVTTAQREAVNASQGYVDSALEALDIPSESLAGTRPAQLVGVASSGALLLPVLYGAVITAKKSMRGKSDVAEALKAGRDRLESTVNLQAADAGRMATSLDMVSHKNVSGMVRVVVPPACDRCVVLAGRYYPWSQGFRRHPKCDCTMTPANRSVEGELTTDPYEYFNSLSQEQQNVRFGKSNAQAIRDGADIFQIVNSRKELYTASGGLKATRYGTTRRGNWGYQQTKHIKTSRSKYTRATKVRLMPEEIYRMAGGNREKALRLLQQNGFVFEQGQNPFGVVRGH
ncbi:Uncharacterised protein [Brevibacterium casei]|uniref:Capsid maturation protease n=2 Tax=Brevibacterium casei TaxID=33889 RepID=A0A449D7X2_9MICO|nr:Uncharacterised protein [Brevibacterium casei]